MLRTRRAQGNTSLAANFLFAGSSAFLLLTAHLFNTYWFLSLFAFAPLLYRMHSSTRSGAMQLGFFFAVSYFGISAPGAPFVSVLGIAAGTALVTSFCLLVWWTRERWGFNPVVVAALWVVIERIVIRAGVMPPFLVVPELLAASPLAHGIAGVFGLLFLSFLIVLLDSLLVSAVKGLVETRAEPDRAVRRRFAPVRTSPGAVRVSHGVYLIPDNRPPPRPVFGLTPSFTSHSSTNVRRITMSTHFRILVAAALLVCLCAVPALAQISGSGQADHTISSMGRFKIVVDDARKPVANAAGVGPYWDNSSGRLTSPVLMDFNTIVRASNLIAQGDGSDIAGATVGVANPGPVKESDYSLRPAGFDNPGVKEVVTDLYSLNMTYFGRDNDSCTGCNNMAAGGLWVVQAGLGQGLSLNPGEVQLHGPDIQSFFDVFVEVTIPGIGVVKNTAPLLVKNDKLTSLPPTVVYIHDNTSAVPVYFRDNGSNGGGAWTAGQFFGYLVLAGHGTDFQCAPGECERFKATTDSIFTAMGEMPIQTPSVPVLSKWGLVALALVLAITAFWLFSRRRMRTAS